MTGQAPVYVGLALVCRACGSNGVRTELRRFGVTVGKGFFEDEEVFVVKGGAPPVASRGRRRRGQLDEVLDCKRGPHNPRPRVPRWTIITALRVLYAEHAPSVTTKSKVVDYPI